MYRFLEPTGGSLGPEEALGLGAGGFVRLGGRVWACQDSGTPGGGKRDKRRFFFFAAAHGWLGTADPHFR